MSRPIHYSNFFHKSLRLLSLSPPPTAQSRYIFFILLGFVNIGLVFVELGAIYIYQNDTFHTTASINEFIDIVQVVLPILSHLAVLVESMAKRKLHQSLQQQSARNSTDTDIALSPVMLKAIVVLVLGISTELAVIASIYKTFFSFARSWYFRVWSLNVLRFQVIQLIVYVEWQSHQWEQVTQELRGLSDIYGTENQKLRLNGVRRRCLELFQFNRDLNELFSWSIFIMVTNYYVCGTIGLYWVMLRFYFARWDLLFEAILIVVAPLVCLVVLMDSCEVCLNRMTNFGAELQQITAPNQSNISTALTTVKRLFSLQLLLLPSHFTGGIFFDLNYYVLGDIIASIASYLLLIFSIRSDTF